MGERKLPTPPPKIDKVMCYCHQTMINWLNGTISNVEKGVVWHCNTFGTLALLEDVKRYVSSNLPNSQLTQPSKTIGKKETNMIINLGDFAKDIVTGFEGIVTGKASYLTGCNQYSLVSKVNKNGESKCNWYDENRIEVLKTKVVEIPTTKIKKGIVDIFLTGGPQENPPDKE
jgi:hypothetical protein